MIIRRYVETHVPPLAATYASLAEKSAIAAAYAVPCASPVLRIGLGDLRDHVADLERPAYVAVENDHSDGCFIRAVATAFRARDIIQALENDWLVIEHGGGQGDVPRRVAALGARFRRVPRLVVIVDSDRMVPGVSGKGDRVAELLKEQGVNVHVLHLREAENYVPNRVLATLGKRRETYRRLDALKRLTPDQRGHFDMKHGFRAGIPEAQATLYADLPAGVMTRLSSGFGERVLESLAAQADALDETDFEGVGPGVAEELRSILAMLREIV